MNLKRRTVEEIERVARFCGCKPTKLMVNPQVYMERVSEIGIYEELGIKVVLDKSIPSNNYFLAVG